MIKNDLCYDLYDSDNGWGMGLGAKDQKDANVCALAEILKKEDDDEDEESKEEEEGEEEAEEEEEEEKEKEKNNNADETKATDKLLKKIKKFFSNN